MTQQGRAGSHQSVRSICTIVFMTAAVTAGIILLCWPPLSQAQQGVEPQTPAQNRPGSEPASSSGGEAALSGYTVAPGDILDVYVVGVPELSRTYRVSPFGRLTLPMLDHQIAAEGLSLDELSEAISQALRQEGFVSHPDVLVSVQSSPSNSVAVTGSVVNPGVYPIFGQTTIVNILSQAGGLATDAGSTAVVMRGPKAMQSLKAADTPDATTTSPMPPRIIKVAIRHVLETDDQDQNLALYPGDNVNVPRAGIVYVVGAVNRAGGFALTGEENRLTVLQTIALAGNTTHSAVTKNAMIIRPNTNVPSGHDEIKVNLKSILSGKAPDRTLSAGDILFVPDSTGKRVVAQALSTAMSVAIYRVPY
jgi:polysaccharide biosynthesis/export protein